MRVAVTGGAGFIGSHLTDSLVSEGHEVVVIDDLSSGKKDYVNGKAVLFQKDIRADLVREFEGADTVFHFAADPDVRSSAVSPAGCFSINVAGTFSVLEACRKAGAKRIVFASTSGVYGEASAIPTPETHPCAPISNYGASKLACEGFLSSYSATYGIKATALRLANIFGERSTHGVMHDFHNKLGKNPKEMEVLGDGEQAKSYLHVSDCVSAVLTAWKKQAPQYDAYNVGSKEKIRVAEIARLISHEMGLSPKLHYTGTQRGWAGDVRLMLLDISKIEGAGWSQRVSIDEGIRRYCRWLQSARPPAHPSPAP